MTSRRQERISELLHQELGLLISAELTDPRLEETMVTVTHVKLSADLHNARVFVEHALPGEKSRHVLAALKHAEGFLRQALAENLNLRVAPELSFAVDETERRARHLDEVLDALAGREAPPAPAATETHEHAG
jgi:ribosome-binding factor A